MKIRNAISYAIAERGLTAAVDLPEGELSPDQAAEIMRRIGVTEMDCGPFVIVASVFEGHVILPNERQRGLQVAGVGTE